MAMMVPVPLEDTSVNPQAAMAMERPAANWQQVTGETTRPWSGHTGECGASVVGKWQSIHWLRNTP